MTRRGVGHAFAASPRRRFPLYAAVAALLVLLGDGITPAHALNTCEEITRCSECVYDQTQGIMPPPLLCGWCESTQSCKQLNSTILAYYGVPTSTTADGTGAEVGGYRAADAKAFRASFCEDLRERDVNGVCPDMFCTASRTTDNIYICRPPAIIALVFGCILFVVSLAMYVWMHTIRQLPWKYEPFLSDMLEGTPLPLFQSHALEDVNHHCADENRDEVDGAPRAAAATATATAAAAATGYCPICKCRQPACLGPGEVCFWCNVARFGFVPFFSSLISSVAVMVLNFTVSLKPWFADGYFASVLAIAYASYGALGVYMVRHHGRAPLFFFESEADRQARQKIWSTTHDRPASLLLSPGVPPSHHNGESHTFDGSGLYHDGFKACSTTHQDQRRHRDEQRLRLLNDARRNMASTYYFRLALRLRGRALLACFPELKSYEALLESMQASPMTLTAVGDAVAVMRAAAAPAATDSRANPVLGFPYGAAAAQSSDTASAAAAAHEAPLVKSFATSPFSATVGSGGPTAASAIEPSSIDAAAGAAAPTQELNGAAELSPATVSPPPSSPGRESDPLTPPARITATIPQPVLMAVESGGCTAKPEEAALSSPAAAAAPSTASPVAPAGNPIGWAVTTNVPESLARQKRGETVQLLSSDFLSPQCCHALKGTLHRDEYITWCSKPSLRGVLMENEWLLMDLAAGFLFGVWMVMLSSVSDNTYAAVQLSGSTSVAACGFITMGIFAVLLIIVALQCNRLYVLTNERLITVYESVITPVTTSTDLSTVRFAALYGYRGLWSKYPCLTFSWEVPATERKMPVIKSHAFPGITNLQEFLFFFRLVAPQTPFHLQQISESMRQDRQEWRLHIFMCVAAFVALPIVTIYPQAVPAFLAVFLHVLGLLLIYATLLRGLRAQQVTYVPLNVAASWAPEGEQSELTSASVPQLQAFASPPPASPPPKAALTQQEPQQVTLQLQEGGARAEQITTPSAPPLARLTVPDLNRAAYPSTVKPAGSPRFAESRSVSAQPAAGSTLPSSSPPGALPPKFATPITTVASTTPRVSAVAIAAIHSAASVLQTTAVPVTSAVREMEMSLTGSIGADMASGVRSASSRFPSSAEVYVSTDGTPRVTTHTPLHRRRSPSADVAGIASGGDGGKTAVGTEGNEPASKSPSHAAPGAGDSPACSLSSSLRHLGSPQETALLQPHPRSQQLGVGRSEGWVATPKSATGLVGGSISGGAAASHEVLRRASFAHVVPASARSTKPDGHTVWGDQTSEQPPL
ncbi:hypothetical protein ABL78_6676 [Leptomonas seymouri]|uniref:PSI domain-containing protein n=1 Tax=Leptomonas seymouri TaxID=5684 RepID=A0A0N1PAH5_LEPSE|nr:hypothetical protein ABL78_6676 [Leptomonas seymouri]|eukprot:KPI84262.1 hypothetical protein ABL78_6676 [Leptomonas seymouri]